MDLPSTSARLLKDAHPASSFLVHDEQLVDIYTRNGRQVHVHLLDNVPVGVCSTLTQVDDIDARMSCRL